MANSVDFRANQIQTTKIIANNPSDPTTSKILVYGISADGSPAYQGNIDTAVFPQDGIGSDVFFYVSGAVNQAGIEANGTSVFGGDLVVSGCLFNGAVDTNVGHGTFAHAEGFSVTVVGDYAHAEGWETQANDVATHAEGYQTFAGGLYSHAEGNQTNATGISSHSEGLYTLASGLYSHTEGYFTTGSGEAGHAEGAYSVAYGQYSHAEGGLTLAKNTFSHAEGQYTLAQGPIAHSEGFRTTASKDYSHSEGESTKADGIGSHVEGYATYTFDLGNPGQGGTYAHTEGKQTSACGDASHAEGYKTAASGAYSHAEGNYSIASGENSHAEGNLSLAYGLYSHAEGSETFAYGEVSHAEGSKSGTAMKGYALVNGSTGVFKLAASYGDISSLFSGGAAIAVYNSGIYRTYVVDSSTFTSPNTRIQVLDNTATGSLIAILGNNNPTNADIILGDGQAGHSEGLSSYAIGLSSHAEGIGTLASGQGSHAEGWFTVAVGTGSHAGGLGTIAYGGVDDLAPLAVPTNAQTVFGRYNIDNNKNSLFVIGNGTDNENRSDIIRVEKFRMGVTGALNVSNGITGSIQYVDEALSLPFIVGTNGITTNYNTVGQWEITGSGGVLYASDATAQNGTGGGAASIAGTGALSTFTLSSPGSLTFTYTSAVMQSPRVVWTLPSSARKVTMYARVGATSGFTTFGYRYIMAGMRYAGEVLPSSALFGMSVNDNDAVYSGDKRTGSNAGSPVGTVGAGVFQLSVIESWYKIIWDLEAGTCSYSFGTGSGGAKPTLWKMLTTSHINGSNNSTAWPIGSNAQIIVFFDSYDNNATPASIKFDSELVIN